MVDSGSSTPVTERPIQSALSSMLRVSDGLLDLLPIATFICDARGTILQYNRHAVAVWGRAPQPGQTHEEFSQDSLFTSWPRLESSYSSWHHVPRNNFPFP